MEELAITFTIGYYFISTLNYFYSNDKNVQKKCISFQKLYRSTILHYPTIM